MHPSPRLTPRRARRALFICAAMTLAASLMSAPVSGSTTGAEGSQGAAVRAVAADKATNSVYIVRFKDRPAVAYRGKLDGFPRTQPLAGERIDRTSTAVRRYVGLLDGQHDAALEAVGVPQSQKLYDYRYSFNGVAATMSASQAAELAARPEVFSVAPQFFAKPQTDNSPEFVGLEGKNKLWDRLGGRRNAGKGVVVGVLDTGVWPEHASFSDRKNPHRGRFYRNQRGRRVFNPVIFPDPPTSWNGTCQSGERWSTSDCNNKLIGARWFVEGFEANQIIEEDYLSPRDADGHGSHTASTAAGRGGVSASILGNDLGKISGMAPRAHVAVYKVCWNGGQGGCAGADLVAAIDQAVADGVDVINYSIGSDSPVLLSGDSVSFLFANEAGVFTATSAGNAGPGAGTVGSPAVAPWVTSVGASTQDRAFVGTVVLGNGERYRGASVTRGIAEQRIVYAADAGNELCLPGEFTNEGLIEGNIVLCDRGVNARVEKSFAVQQAGGVGMVLANVVPNDTIFTDTHYVPSVHLIRKRGNAVRSYIAEAGEDATARLIGGRRHDVAGNRMASFSSRGPNGGAPDIITPDVTAPGVQVLAANTPTPFTGAGQPGQMFQAIAGTSMSSPHVAGIAALLTQRHGLWSPAMMESALITTARRNVTKENGAKADPFDYGGGHVRATRSDNPGLVYDADFDDYLDFLRGTGDVASDEGAEIPDPSNLNLATIGVADLAGIQTVTRTVTNVGPSALYTANTTNAPRGVTMSVNPPLLRLNTGESATYEVTFTVTDDAQVNEWAFGSLNWTDGDHSVRSPVAVRPVPIAAPDEVLGDGNSGDISYDVTFGYSGEFAAEPRGLEPATEYEDTVQDDPNNSFDPGGAGITTHEVTVAEGTEYARFSLFDEETDGEDDLDLYVFNADGEFVGGSGSGTSEEQVDLVAPPAGVYTVYVHGWETDGPSADYTLFEWQVSSADRGNMTVDAPEDATLGETAEVTVAWDGLADDTRYMGAVTYHDTDAPADYRDGLIGQTIVRVDVGEPSGP